MAAGTYNLCTQKAGSVLPRARDRSRLHDFHRSLGHKMRLSQTNKQTNKTNKGRRDTDYVQQVNDTTNTQIMRRWEFMSITSQG